MDKDAMKSGPKNCEPHMGRTGMPHQCLGVSTFKIPCASYLHCQFIGYELSP
jgi:hypothetical protein